METLEALAMMTFMSLFKDLETWEDVEEKVEDMEDGWKTWVLRDKMMAIWARMRVQKKKDLFKNVHQQLVSTTLIV